MARRKHETQMISHAQARSMAQQLWGTVNTSYRTNRRGAFYFSCSGHGGMILDGRCLDAEEASWISKYISPDFASETYNTETGGIMTFTSPFNKRAHTTRFYARGRSYAYRQTPIFVAEEDGGYAIPAVFAGIVAGVTRVRDPSTEERLNEAFETFLRQHQISAHERLDIQQRFNDVIDRLPRKDRQ